MKRRKHLTIEKEKEKGKGKIKNFYDGHSFPDGSNLLESKIELFQVRKFSNFQSIIN